MIVQKYAREVKVGDTITTLRAPEEGQKIVTITPGGTGFLYAQFADGNHANLGQPNDFGVEVVVDEAQP